MALVAAASEDDNRGKFTKIFHLSGTPGEAPREEKPAQALFSVFGIDRNQQVQASERTYCSGLGTIKLAF